VPQTIQEIFQPEYFWQNQVHQGNASPLFMEKGGQNQRQFGACLRSRMLVRQSFF